MCDKIIEYLDKYQHRLAHLFPCNKNCESKLTGCSYNRDLIKLVKNRFYYYFHRTQTITIRFFILIATLAIQHDDFNYDQILDHLLEFHSYMFTDVIFRRVVLRDDWRSCQAMSLFIKDCIQLFSVSSDRKC